jgi:hypothetical protein
VRRLWPPPGSPQPVVGFDVLDQESARTGTQGGEDVLVEPVVGQDHHMHAGQAGIGGDPAGGLDAVQHGHLDIDQGDIRYVLCGERDALLPVGGLGDHLDVVLGLEQRAGARPDERLVVDQQNPDHGVGPGSGMSARTVNPPSGRGSEDSRPPSALTRSRMPISPTPGTGGASTLAMPSSSTRTASALGPRSMELSLTPEHGHRCSPASGGSSSRRGAAPAVRPRMVNGSPASVAVE